MGDNRYATLSSLSTAISGVNTSKISHGQAPEYKYTAPGVQDKTTVRVSELGQLGTDGAPVEGSAYMRGQNEFIEVVGGELCRPVGYEPVNTWGNRQIATIGVVQDVISYNREAIETRDTQVLTDAKTYADSLIGGFDITGTPTTTGFNTTKNLQLENTDGQTTGLVVGTASTTLKGDLISNGTNTDLGTLSKTDRLRYVPTAGWVDATFAELGSLSTEVSSRQNADTNLQNQITTITSAGYQTSSQVTSTVASALTPYQTTTQADAKYRGASAPFGSIVSTDSKNKIEAATNNNGLQLTCDGVAVGRITK